MAFKDFDVELQDEKGSTPEQLTGTVGTDFKTLTPTSTDKIKLAYIKNPNKGENSNSINDVIYVNIDGGTEVTTISRGEYSYFVGVFDSIKVRANTEGVTYEIILWS